MTSSTTTPPAPGRAEGYTGCGGTAIKRREDGARLWIGQPCEGCPDCRPAPGRAEAISDEQLDALEEMAATVAVKGPLLRELIAEVRASRRPAPAIVAEVGETPALRWVKTDEGRGLEAKHPGGTTYHNGAPDTEWVLAEDYDAALRTLAEVRGEADHARDVCRVMERDLKAQRDAATQRAEKAEAVLARVERELRRMVGDCALPAPATNATGEDSSLRADVVANT